MSRFVIGRLIQVSVVNGVPLMVDDALWVRLTSGALGYLDGNPHTRRLGVGVWDTSERLGYLSSLADIEAMSDASRAWIAGYLHGNEPGLEEYLGVDHEHEYSDDEWRQWRIMLERYWQTGLCPPLNRRPTSPIPMTEAMRRAVKLRPWEPWAYAGERVWVQRGGQWAMADPQPEVDFDGTRVGSVCDGRFGHEMEEFDDAPGWTVCVDCGLVDANRA